jgi:hypothetical protein
MLREGKLDRKAEAKETKVVDQFDRRSVDVEGAVR